MHISKQMIPKDQILDSKEFSPERIVSGAKYKGSPFKKFFDLEKKFLNDFPIHKSNIFSDPY